jgi:hypothetical protein
MHSAPTIHPGAFRREEGQPAPTPTTFTSCCHSPAWWSGLCVDGGGGEAWPASVRRWPGQEEGIGGALAWAGVLLV